MATLANACVVTGLVQVYNTALESVALPRLESAGGLSIEDNTDLSSVLLPALASVSGDLSITLNPALTTVAFMPVLVSVGGGLTVYDNENVTSISLPELSTVGEFAEFRLHPV